MRDRTDRDERHNRYKNEPGAGRGRSQNAGSRPPSAGAARTGGDSRGNASAPPDLAMTIEQTGVIGTVKKVIPEKGFGFIVRTDTGVEYFFHKSAYIGSEVFETLEQGAAVIFDAMKSAKGPRAQQVRDAHTAAKI